MLFGVLCIVFSKRLGRNAVKHAMWTRFQPLDVAIVLERRKLEEDGQRWVFTGAGVLLIAVSLWILLTHT